MLTGEMADDDHPVVASNSCFWQHFHAET